MLLDATSGLTGIISESLSNAGIHSQKYAIRGWRQADDWSNKDDNGLSVCKFAMKVSPKEG